MLIRNPKAEAEANQHGVASTEKLIQKLTETLHEGTAAQCIELLSSWPQLPANLRDLMLRRMLAESDVRLQQVFMNHLIPGLQQDELVLLLDQLNSDDASLRSQIIDGLSQVNAQQQNQLLLPELQERLRKGDRDTRILTLNLLTWLENPELLPAVEQLLEEEQDINVCMTALDALPALNADPDLPVLDQIAERFQEEPYVSFALQTIRKELAALKARNDQNKES